MKKPYSCIKAVCAMALILLLQTSFAQEVETQQQQTNTDVTNVTQEGGTAQSLNGTLRGDPGVADNNFFPNPLMDDVLSSKSSGSSAAQNKSFHVDKSTGKVNVKVPIATVGPEGLKIPIELNYTTGGVKVEDVASWVGLGWDLSAGGKITRVMRRFPDKFDHSWDSLLNESTWKSRFWTNRNDDNFDTRLQNEDTQPDLFYFEIPGKSGMFAFDKDNKAHTIPYQNIKINYDITSETFEIIDDQGTRYYFNDNENTLIHESDDWEEENDINYKSTWYLSSAYNIKGEEVLFEYKPLDNQRKYFYETKDKSMNLSIAPATHKVSSEIDSIMYKNYIDPLYLTKIAWDNGSVEFISTADREDIPDQQAFKLNSIRLYSGGNLRTLLKSYNFEYSTFPNNNKALRLNKITLSAAGETEFYRKFDYFPMTGVGAGEMVKKYQIDHWGYYNGPGSRTGIPTTDVGVDNHVDVDYNTGYNDDEFRYSASGWGGSDTRTPVFVHTLANSLQRIWVTGSGYDEFEYELNTRKYYIPRNNKPDSVAIENVGGLRIKSITTKSTELANAVMKVRYEYADDDCASSGVTFNDPHYYYFSSMNGTWYYFTITDSPIRPLFDLDGSHIRYGKVKEIFDNGSSNTYYYTTKEDHSDKNYIAYNVVKGNIITSMTKLVEKNLDFAPNSTQFWKRGLLTKKISLDALGNETRLETFEYNTETNIKGRVKGFFPYTDKLIIYINTNVPPGVPGQDYDGNPRVQWILKNAFLAEYEYLSQPINLTKQTVRGIDIPETVTEYRYDDNDGFKDDLDDILLKEIIVKCGADSSKTTYKYPFDYIKAFTTEEGNAIQFMQENKISSVPIEVVTYKNDKIIGGKLYIYDTWHYTNNGSITGTMFNLKEVKELVLKTPKSVREFIPSSHLGFSLFTFDSNYVTKTAYEYNRANKVSCIKERNEPSRLFLYGNDPERPISQISNAEAKVINGSYCEEAFYNGFEDADGTTHPRAKSGAKVLTDGYYTDLSGLAAGSYWVSFWQSFNDGVDWELYETEVEVMENDGRPFTIGGQGAIIDEYRIWKKGAQMQTTTYDTKLNISSSTDENGKTTYYEYDAFGRLLQVSDNNRDIIKKYKYFIRK